MWEKVESSRSRSHDGFWRERLVRTARSVSGPFSSYASTDAHIRKVGIS